MFTKSALSLAVVVASSLAGVSAAFARGHDQGFTYIPSIGNNQALAIQACREVGNASGLPPGEVVGAGLPLAGNGSSEFAVVCNRNGTLIPSIGNNQALAIQACGEVGNVSGLPPGEVMGIGLYAVIGPKAFAVVCKRPTR